MKLPIKILCAVAVLSTGTFAEARPYPMANPLAATQAPSAVGDWQGSLTTPSGDILINLSITAENGGFAGVMTPEIPGVAPASVVVTQAAPRLVFSAPSMGGSFEADWNAELGGWSGQWSQSGYRLPLTLRPAPAPAAVIAGLDGVWNGGIERDGRRFRMVLKISTGARGTVLRFDAVDGGAENLPTTEFSREGDRIRFSVPAAGARFDGVVSGNRLSGDWLFPGRPTARAEFERTEAAPQAAAAPRRPQTPSLPLPYAVEEVRVAVMGAPGVVLAGTLTLPNGDGPFPGVVLVSGSGQQDRNSAMNGHKPFEVLADYLTRRGIAVLRYDDRGSGASTGTFRLSTPADFAADAGAALNHLSAHAKVDGQAVGLVGHSEGGLTSAIAASQNRDLDYLVLLASPGMPMRDVMLAQRRLLGAAAGTPESVLVRSEPIIASILDTIANADTDDMAEAEMRKILTAENLAALGMRQADGDLFTQQMSRSGIRHSLLVNPADYLRTLTVPVMALDGSLDRQVAPEENLAAIRNALLANNATTVLNLDGLNHMFQTAQTGGVAEYAQIEETFSPSAMAIIADWILEHDAR